MFQKIHSSSFKDPWNSLSEELTRSKPCLMFKINKAENITSYLTFYLILVWVIPPEFEMSQQHMCGYLCLINVCPVTKEVWGLCFHNMFWMYNSHYKEGRSTREGASSLVYIYIHIWILLLLECRNWSLMWSIFALCLFYEIFILSTNIS